MISSWAQFISASVLVVAAGFFLVRYADTIARETGLGRVWAGLILLATATSLPELAAGVGAVSLVGSNDLAAGGAFGSNVFNLLLIALLGLFPAWRAMLNFRTGEIVRLGVGGAILILLGISLLLVSRDDVGLPVFLLAVLPVSLPIAYFVTVIWIFGRRSSLARVDQVGEIIPTPESPGPDGGSDSSLAGPIVGYAVTATVVILSGIWLANSADSIAVETGWSQTFAGSLILAVSTSLPELAVAIAALRIHAPALALSNLLGSNIFNMGGVLAADAAAQTSEPFFASISPVHAISGAAGIVMTAILVFVPSRIRPETGQGIDWPTYIKVSATVGVFLAASALVFVRS